MLERKVDNSLCAFSYFIHCITNWLSRIYEKKHPFSQQFLIWKNRTTDDTD